MSDILSTLWTLLVALAVAADSTAGTAPADAAPAPLTTTAAKDVDETALAAGRELLESRVRPMLEERCVRCHGPKRQRGGLRLDHGPSALQGGDSGATIVPGDPKASRLIELVTSADPETRMPPRGDPLDAEEVAALSRWIELGAPWPKATSTDDDLRVESDHWAFQPPSRPEVPSVSRPEWVRQPIDAFVLRQLDEADLEPSEDAAPETLVRRLWIDLTGLPPTAEELEEALADDSPEAWDKIVDRLLASPAHAELRAARWLDLARYADTNGYEKDRVRSMWPWRDWVIRAYEEDLPFDRFTIEQLAGDLLPDAGLSERVATGFHRNTMINEEGGVDVEQFRFEAVVDRASTTGSVWLGLTLGCAQCHSHKYDPISQREYWGIFAFLNNADEPEIFVPTRETVARRTEIDRRIDELVEALPDRFPIPPGPAETTDERRRAARETAFRGWVEVQAARARPWSTPRPTTLVAHEGATLTVLDDLSILASGDNPNRDSYELELPLPAGELAAVRLEALPHESLPGGGPGRAPLFSRGDFLLSEISAELLLPADLASGSSPVSHALPFAQGLHDHASGGRSAQLALDGQLDTGWAVGADTARAHQAVFRLAAPVDVPPGAVLRVRLDQHYIHQQTLGRFRLSISSAPDATATGLPYEIEEILTRPLADRSPDHHERLHAYWLRVAPELREAHEEITRLERSKPDHPTTLVLEERRVTPRVTRRHHRGEFLSPREEVSAHVPAVLHALPADTDPDRLAFARWLVDADNPLAARVAANRLWRSVFGEGIVRTLEDFGTRGEAPSHPELLDWLATELRDSGWGTKRLLRRLVTSATYRQSSAVRPELLARDPGNRLLGRAPRYRIDAESVRDLALSVSGLLSRKIGGPSVFPPQPAEVTALSYGALSWNVSGGEDRYRRGLYTFRKRTSPYATFTVFDAPSGETCCVRRGRSNTPLQALTLLNDEVFIEASRALARRVFAELDQREPGGAASERRIERGVERAFLHVLSREPTAAESERCVRFVVRQRDRLASGELSASGLLEAEGPHAAELGAWAALSRVLLNLDETITRE